MLGFDGQGRVEKNAERPASTTSQYTVTGIYFYDATATLRPSARGELEITDVNLRYLAQGTLEVCFMGRGSACFDTGTHDSLQEASSFIQTQEKRQGLKVAAREEIAWRRGWISDDELKLWHILWSKVDMVITCYDWCKLFWVLQTFLGIDSN